MNARPDRIAWIAGANGLTGRALVDTLLGAPDYARVLAITRRPLGRQHARLANRTVPDFANLAASLAGHKCHDAYCCLGTTLSKAGSEAAFRAADLDSVVLFARAAQAAGATRLLVISAIGADATARGFYQRVKGEMETAVAALGYAAVDIMQPGLLLGGERAESRPVETLSRIAMPWVNPLLRGGLADYRGIDVADLAGAMLGASRSGRRGVTRYRGRALQKLARAVRDT